MIMAIGLKGRLNNMFFKEVFEEGTVSMRTISFILVITLVRCLT